MATRKLEMQLIEKKERQQVADQAAVDLSIRTDKCVASNPHRVKHLVLLRGGKKRSGCNYKYWTVFLCRRVDAGGQGLLDIPRTLWQGGTGVGRLAKVSIVDLSHNHLRHVPGPFVYWLGSLKKLDLSYNELVDVPVSTPGPAVSPVLCVRALGT